MNMDGWTVIFLNKTVSLVLHVGWRIIIFIKERSLVAPCVLLLRTECVSISVTQYAPFLSPQIQWFEEAMSCLRKRPTIFCVSTQSRPILPTER